MTAVDIEGLLRLLSLLCAPDGSAQLYWDDRDVLFGGHSFFANRVGSLRTYVSDDGAGSYRLTVRPYAGTHWYAEVDALE